MLAFERLGYGNMDAVKEYFERDNIRYRKSCADITCDLVFGTTFLWRDFYSTEFAVLGDSLVLRISNGGTSMFSSPFGDKSIPAILRELREYCRLKGEPLYFCFVPEKDLHYFRETYDLVFETAELDWYDYVYDKDSLALFPGKRYHRQKNHINKFIRAYPNGKFVPITNDNSSLVRDYAVEWYDRYSDDSDMSVAEECAVCEMLSKWNTDTGIDGGFVESEGRILGFTLGEIIGDTVYVHIEKAEHDNNGGYQFLASEYLKSISDKGVQFVNREEDMGIPGLRKSKESLHPVKLLKKYTLYCC